MKYCRKCDLILCVYLLLLLLFLLDWCTKVQLYIIQKKIVKSNCPVKGRPRVSSVCPSEITRRVFKTAGRRSTSQGARGRKSGKNAGSTITTLSGQMSIREMLRNEEDKKRECVPDDSSSSGVAFTREVDDGHEN